MIRIALCLLLLAGSGIAQEDGPPWAAEHAAGDVAVEAGDYATALTHYRKAAALAAKTAGPESVEAARELWFVADCQYRLKEYDAAEKNARRVLDVFETDGTTADEDLGRILGLIAVTCRDAGKLRRAHMAMVRVHQISSELRGAKHDETLDALREVAHIEYRLGRYGAALSRARIAIEEYEKREPLDVDRLIPALGIRGVCLAKLGRREEALPDYRRVLELDIEHRGKDHPATAIGENNLGGLLRDMGRYEESEKHYLRAIEIYRAQPGGQPTDIAYPLNGLADVRRKQKRIAEAERLCREGLAIREERLPEGDATTATSLVSLAEILHDAKRDEEAEEVCERAFGILSAKVDTSNSEFVRLIECWIAVLMTGEKTAAIAEVDRKVRALEEAQWQEVRRTAGFAEVEEDLEMAELEWRRAIEVAGETEKRLRVAEAGLGRTLIAAGKHREGIPHLVKAADLYRKTPEEDEFPRVRNLIRLIDALDAIGRRDETAPFLREALPYLRKAHDAKAAWALEGFIAALAQSGNIDEALPLARKLGEGHRVRNRVLFLAGRYREAERGYRIAVENDRSSGAPWLGIARIRKEQGRLDEAEVYARKCIALDGETAVSLELLASIVEALGRKKEAAALRARK